MDIQIVGPASGTGYGVVATHLCWALSQLPDTEVRFMPIGPVDTSWFETKVQTAVADAIRLEALATQKPDFTLCVWHEWDHPPHHVRASKLGSLSDRYVAMPTFELDRIKTGAVGCLAKSWKVLVSSQHCHEVLLKAGLKNTSMVHFHGVDTNVFNPQLLGKGPRMRLLNIGKMEKRKGHDMCIKALAWCLSDGMEDIELWCMWENPFIRGAQELMMDKWIADAVDTYGVSGIDLRDRIKRIGPRERPTQVAAVINSCDVGLYPFRAEGWNLPLLETLACGLPTIATYYSGPVDYLTGFSAAEFIGGSMVVAEDGIWFGPGKNEGRWMEPDLSGICHGIHKMHIQWQSGQSRNPNGVKVAQEFTWSKAAKRVRSWLESGCELSS